MSEPSHQNGSAPPGQPTRAEALRLLRSHARPHYRVGAVALLGTLLVVLTRIAMPWPLRGVIEVVFPERGSSAFLERVLPAAGDPVLWLCGAYLVLASLSGLSEFLQRVWMTRFATQTVHDLRASALGAVRRGPVSHDPAALVSRAVGDSARLKTNLVGILVHLSQNGLLIVGVTVVFLVIAPKMGLLLLASGLVALLLGYVTVDEVAETSLKQRESESRYAVEIHRGALSSDSDREAKLNRKSSRRQVRTARLLARASLLSHVGVAATISLALWIGVADVRAGDLEPGELFLFIAYALTLHHRAVRVGRQVARFGKVAANAQRLAALVQGVREGEAPPLTLSKEIRLEGLRVRAVPGRTKRNRLGPLDLPIPAGAKVAVLGGVGAGKSSLLGVLAGRVAPHKGRIAWDAEELTHDTERLGHAVGFVPQEIVLEACPLRPMLGSSAEDPELLRLLGASRVLQRLADGSDATVDFTTLTPHERRALMIAAVVGSSADVWVLDSPVDTCGRRDRERLESILDRSTGRTVIAALPKPCLIDRFTHVVVLRRARIVFIGSPLEWREWKRKTPTDALSA